LLKKRHRPNGVPRDPAGGPGTLGGAGNGVPSIKRINGGSRSHHREGQRLGEGGERSATSGGLTLGKINK